MERQIVFRGKRKDNGKWIHGDLQLGDGDVEGFIVCDVSVKECDGETFIELD